MKKQGWIESLKSRWKLKNAGQVFLILLVFACTGTTVLIIKRPITDWLYADQESSTVFTVLYWILIFPVYNVLLLLYGMLFGQFTFFWNYEKRFFSKILGKKKGLKAPLK